jgi:flavin reductase (DIM6/NTAB) family NADH-FMN oxidoreductase RutF
MNTSRELAARDRAARCDARDLRAALGQFATGVTIVTTRGSDGRRVGLTVNSFTSVSLDPPLVLWCLSRDAASMRHFIGAERFAVNVLAVDQIAIARRFASRHVDRFADVACSIGLGGVPLIEGAIAHFVCRSMEQHRAGDHFVFIGEVQHHECFGGEPLVFHAGEYRMAPHCPAARN